MQTQHLKETQILIKGPQSWEATVLTATPFCYLKYCFNCRDRNIELLDDHGPQLHYLPKEFDLILNLFN